MITAHDGVCLVKPHRRAKGDDEAASRWRKHILQHYLDLQVMISHHVEFEGLGDHLAYFRQL